jgi:hypothetical protein
MKFPNLTWDVVAPILSVLYLQWTVSVACYGHFLRTLTTAERGAFVVVSFVGFAGLVTHGIAVNVIFGAIACALMGWVWLTAWKRKTAERVETSTTRCARSGLQAPTPDPRSARGKL